jgi:pimeloyl-ACP methyl ester carboxylesterase
MVTTGTLALSGTDLYYEIRGDGPVLLLVAGGNGDAGPFAPVADALAETHTVVSYDRRGFSRSRAAGIPADRIATDSADAAALLAELTTEPAFVFGSSSGAIVGLELLTRSPERVRLLVAHEPPSFSLLPDADSRLAVIDSVLETYRTSGVETAMRQFSAEMGIGEPQRPPEGTVLPEDLIEMITRIQANLPFWIENELHDYPRYVPDLDALGAVADRLVLAGGRDSREHAPYLPNTVIAERFGKSVVDLPGGHIGYSTEVAEFAKQLAAILR